MRDKNRQNTSYTCVKVSRIKTEKNVSYEAGSEHR